MRLSVILQEQRNKSVMRRRGEISWKIASKNLDRNKEKIEIVLIQLAKFTSDNFEQIFLWKNISMTTPVRQIVSFPPLNFSFELEVNKINRIDRRKSIRFRNFADG